MWHRHSVQFRRFDSRIVDNTSTHIHSNQHRECVADLHCDLVRGHFNRLFDFRYDLHSDSEYWSELRDYRAVLTEVIGWSELDTGRHTIGRRRCQRRSADGCINWSCSIKTRSSLAEAGGTAGNNTPTSTPTNLGGGCSPVTPQEQANGSLSAMMEPKGIWSRV
jgi:hypothetical protein